MILITPFLFTSCASVLNGKQQKVTINAINKNSKVFLNNENVGKGSNVVAKFNRDRGVKQITVKTDGYKDVNFVHYQSKKSPLYIMSWVPFGVLFYTPFMDVGNKSYDYEKEISSKEKLIKIPVKKETEKFLFVQNTAFEVNEKDLTVKIVKKKNYNKNKVKKFKELDKNNEAIKFDNSIFTDALNEILVNYKYTDSTNTIFKSVQNSLFLSATIKKVNVKNVYDVECKTYMYFLESDIEIEWNLLDIYGQSLYKENSKYTSGQFSIDVNKKETVLLSIKDAIEGSLFNFVNDNKVREFLKITNEKEKMLSEIKITKGTLVSNLEESLKATVTIKTKEGHGSGFVISNDGYIITNFHVIAKAKESEIIVIDNKGKEHLVKIIRKNEILDLALLKIEHTFSNHFGLVDEKNYKIGQDIYVIGTPKSIELGQTLNKGIISGERTKENLTYIQVDASVNGGNSGGPLVDKDGVLIGVVNAKLSGVGVEGIGFSIPGFKIKSALNIIQ